MLSLHVFDIWLITALLMQSKKDGAQLKVTAKSDMIGLFGGCVGCVFILITMAVGFY